MDADATLLSMTLRPQVPLHFMQGTPFVAAMGLVDGLRAAGHVEACVAWPHNVVAGGASLRLSTRGGYDDEGMFVALEVKGSAPCALDGAVAEAMRARVSAWGEAVQAGRSQAGPLAFALSELFDMVGLMGKPVDVTYPNGRVFDRGYLAGIDVWGRATIKRLDGSELEIAPEQAGVRARG